MESPRPPNAPTGIVRPLPRAVWRQPVALSSPSPSRGARCAEVAGGAAADCAVVCCCCPVGLVGLLVLAVVKVPAGLCRRSFLRMRRKMGAAAAAARRRKAGGDDAERDSTTRAGLLGGAVDGGVNEDDVGGGGGWWPAVEESPSAEVWKMEREMWARFYGGGFWRTASQREM